MNEAADVDRHRRPPHGIYVNFRQSSTYINHGFLVRSKSCSPAR